MTYTIWTLVTVCKITEAQQEDISTTNIRYVIRKLMICKRIKNFFNLLRVWKKCLVKNPNCTG